MRCHASRLNILLHPQVVTCNCCVRHDVFSLVFMCYSQSCSPYYDCHEVASVYKALDSPPFTKYINYYTFLHPPQNMHLTPFAVVFSLAASATAAVLPSRISGGTPVKQNELPFVGEYREGNCTCTGSLIGPQAFILGRV